MTLILPEPAEHFTWKQGTSGPAGTGVRLADPSAAGPVLQCDPLAAIAPHFFTTRVLQLRPDAPQAFADWVRVAAAIGVPVTQLRRMHQVHGCTTFVLDGSASPNPSADPNPEADAIVTERSDVALVVRVADCVPLLMADRRTGAVAAVHAGWRGTAAGIAAAAVRRLRDTFRTDPSDIVAAIGPSIGACCYQVGPEVRDAFLAAGHAPDAVDAWFARDTRDARDRWRLDTWTANRDQLIGAGVRAERVYVARLCTMTHLPSFYSYRAEGASTGRLLGVIRRSA